MLENTHLYPLYYEMRSSGKKNPYLKYGLDSQCTLDLDDFGLENKECSDPNVTTFDSVKSSKDNVAMAVQVRILKYEGYIVEIVEKSKVFYSKVVVIIGASNSMTSYLFFHNDTHILKSQEYARSLPKKFYTQIELNFQDY